MSSQDLNKSWMSLLSSSEREIPLPSILSSPVFLRVLLVFLPIITWSLYSGLTNPLRKLPGPSISRWTNLKLQYITLAGTRGWYLQALHDRYGPIVRISPYEVSVSDVAAVKSIYRVGSPFLKSVWYSDFTGETKDVSLLTVTDPHVHAHWRKLVAHSFSEKWIQNLEPYIAKTVRLAIEKMAGDIKEHGYTDIYKWFTFMATDVIGESSFGESFRMLETGQKTQYIKDIEDIPVKGMLRAEFPLITRILHSLPFINRGLDLQRTRMKKYSKESIMRYWKLLKAEGENVKPTLLTKAYAAVEDGTMTADQLELDAVIYIIAGTDTTALTVTNVVCATGWFHGCEPAECKLLNNVITETIRIRPTVGQTLLRVVPKGGAEMCGHRIPPGTTIGAQTWTMHHNPAVFKDPEKFIPERWNDPSKEMSQSYYPFGGGSRACIGANFAQLELRHALANFYRTFPKGVSISSAESFSKAEMDVDTYFVTLPKGHRCVIQANK